MTIHNFNRQHYEGFRDLTHPLCLDVGLCLITGFVNLFSAHSAHSHVIVSMVSVPRETTVTIDCKVFYLYGLGHYLSLPIEWNYLHCPVCEAVPEVLSHLLLVIYT